jgi:tol-pal system protein YbgF
MIRRMTRPMGEPAPRRGTIAALVVALLAGAAPGHAANKDIERLQLQVATLQSQIGDLVRVHEDSVKELRRLNELLAEQNASLKKTLQEQRVQEEANAAALRDLGERLSELNEKYQSLKAVPPPVVATDASGFPPAAPAVPGNASPPPFGASPAPSPAAPAPVPVSAPAPRELYSQAYADFARGNYDLAVQGFTEYIKNYPGTDFTDNAQYWVGECLYGKKQYNEAIEAWNTLFRDYPSSDKLPDARVKKGMALERLGRRSQALVEYRFVIDRFPNSPAARIARERLNP